MQWTWWEAVMVRLWATGTVNYVASNEHLGLMRTPYVLYGVKYSDLVSVGLHSRSHLGLMRTPCVLYGVKYSDLVSVGLHSDSHLDLNHAPIWFIWCYIY